MKSGLNYKAIAGSQAIVQSSPNRRHRCDSLLGNVTISYLSLSVGEKFKRTQIRERAPQGKAESFYSKA